MRAFERRGEGHDAVAIDANALDRAERARSTISNNRGSNARQNLKSHANFRENSRRNVQALYSGRSVGFYCRFLGEIKGRVKSKISGGYEPSTGHAGTSETFVGFVVPSRGSYFGTGESHPETRAYAYVGDERIHSYYICNSYRDEDNCP